VRAAWHGDVRKRYHVNAVNATRRAFLLKYKALAYNARSFYRLRRIHVEAPRYEQQGISV